MHTREYHIPINSNQKPSGATKPNHHVILFSRCAVLCGQMRHRQIEQVLALPYFYSKRSRVKGRRPCRVRGPASVHRRRCSSAAPFYGERGRSFHVILHAGQTQPGSGSYESSSLGHLLLYPGINATNAVRRPSSDASLVWFRGNVSLATCIVYPKHLAAVVSSREGREPQRALVASRPVN